ncbi:hypothetical protein EMIHUDRAFT_431773 [Emiliania huxleyi CCMP1516]|uniref:CRAL-TRIO domain-containing protein n=3 Tax=Emiliania huxleyi TaxID=2903 RepID=A0A0D3L111_EMIH1|nr:hypothetical protein EMIHUDRAFT_431773 [Emiliania huxleyi CCMP1516]EOD41696.1 hypothetical protein EMIHUDRAFT_431773 [Emiliania huxleyi CCMP1516]|eukprot:XP_005794125.1 hypothetical protein EMIHUDRAFT_431773 [Emiliania huxleyi CCMP1516]
MERRGECIAHLSRADLLRWLRARKLHVGKSSDFLQADLAWRRKHRIEERSGEDADAVLGCEVAKLKAFLPHENPPCLDRRGRPVIIKHFGHVYFSRLLNSTNITLDQLCDYNWWVNEQYTRRLNEVGAEQWLIICDAKGFSPTQMDRVALKVLKSMANIDADHYPERLGGFVIINAPASLAFVWKIVSAWLDEKTKAKVQIISAGEPKRAREHLHSLIDPAQLPAQYGGTAPALEEWPAWPAKSGVPPPKSPPKASPAK